MIVNAVFYKDLCSEIQGVNFTYFLAFFVDDFRISQYSRASMHCSVVTVFQLKLTLLLATTYGSDPKRFRQSMK